MNCAFCDVEDSLNQKVILKNDLVLFIQNESKQGSLKHSGLIISIAHRETVFDLRPEEISASFELLKQVKELMDEKYEPDGYNIGWNCGSVGGQEIFHAHMHVIPRFKKEPLAGKGIRAHLKSDVNKW